MKLAGITLVAKGNKLGYPYQVCIQNLLDCCDKVYVSLDSQDEDFTNKTVSSLSQEVVSVTSKWNWGITNGTDLAYRANLALALAKEEGYTHCLYVQADEIVSPKEINGIKSYIGNINYALERTYFWKDFFHINLTWTHNLIRLCPITNKVKIVSDGMFLEPDSSFENLTVLNRLARIYHYSRVGNSKMIANRLNNLDTLFHEKKEFTPLNDYTFGKNNNFEEGAKNAEVQNVKLVHPPGIEEFYNG